MWENSAIWMSGGTIAIAVLCLVLFFNGKRTESRHRRAQLQIVRESLKIQSEAMLRFVEDPAAPLAACELLVEVSEIAADRDKAHIVVTNMLERINSGKMGKKLNSTAQEMVSQMKELRKTRSDLVDDFDTALINALMLTFLRWPETADLFENAAARLLKPNSGLQLATAASIDLRGTGGMFPPGAVPC